LKFTCGPYRADFDGKYDAEGYFGCNKDIAANINSGASFGGYAEVSCCADKEAGILFSTSNVNGICAVEKMVIVYIVFLHI